MKRAAKKKVAKRTNWKRRALLLRETLKDGDELFDKLDAECDALRAERDELRAKLELTEVDAARLREKLREAQRPTREGTGPDWVGLVSGIAMIIAFVALAIVVNRP